MTAHRHAAVPPRLPIEVAAVLQSLRRTPAAPVQPRSTGAALAVVAGFLLAALLARGLHGQDRRARFALGGFTGLVFFGVSLLWLNDFLVAGYVAVTALEALLLAGTCLFVPADGRRWWALPSALVLLEALRDVFPFGGFPLPNLALSQVDGPLAASVALGGPFLLTWLAAALGTGAVASVLARSLRPAAFVAVPVGLTLVAGALLPAANDRGALDVAVVQGGGERGLRAVLSDQSFVLERALAASGRIDSRPDLVVWPENVFDVDGSVRESPAGGRVADVAQRLQATVVTGVVERDDTRFRNLAVAWDPSGAIVGSYDKVHRVPFGEYVPGRRLLEGLVDLSLIPRDARPGREPGRLDTAAGPLGVAISYEVFFPDRTRAAVRAGGQVLLVPTNAASYKRADVPAMELAAARLRALETDRAVLQAAPTGYSAVIQPDGHVESRSDLSASTVLLGRVPLRTSTTPYTASGDLPMLALAAVGLLAAWRTRAPLQRATTCDDQGEHGDERR